MSEKKLGRITANPLTIVPEEANAGRVSPATASDLSRAKNDPEMELADSNWIAKSRAGAYKQPGRNETDEMICFG
jgi:hypothetical protein